MMTTSRGAEETRCPILILADRTDTGDTGCLGVGCMMWRWSEPPPLPEFIPCLVADAKTEPPGCRPDTLPAWFTWTPAEEGNEAGWLEDADQARSRRLGYCGLAGEPRGGE